MKQLICRQLNFRLLNRSLIIAAVICASVLMPGWCGDQAVDQNPERIRQAKKFIEASQHIRELGENYIAQAEKSVEEAKHLKGGAHVYQSNMGALHGAGLKGKALDDARKQFQLDRALFAKHVDLYKMHTDEVRQQFGLCKASLKAYEELRKEYSLHCDQFHLPDVPPPHVCLEAGTSVEEAASLVNRVREVNRRQAAEEEDLAKAERKLQQQLAQSGKIDEMAITKSQLALKEQALAVEFAQLKEEHHQLDVAKRVLTGSSVAVPQVKGKIKPKPKP